MNKRLMVLYVTLLLGLFLIGIPEPVTTVAGLSITTIIGIAVGVVALSSFNPMLRRIVALLVGVAFMIGPFVVPQLSTVAPMMMFAGGTIIAWQFKVFG